MAARNTKFPVGYLVAGAIAGAIAYDETYGNQTTSSAAASLAVSGAEFVASQPTSDGTRTATHRSRSSGSRFHGSSATDTAQVHASQMLLDIETALSGLIVTSADETHTSGYIPDRTLPTDKNGPIPDADVPHTQLGNSPPKYGGHPQAREWGYGENGQLQPLRDIDFSDHGSPDIHSNPHEHVREPNNPAKAPVGGSRRGKPQKFLW